MQSKDNFYTGRCGISPYIETNSDYCKAKIDYLLQKEPKERYYKIGHLYTFPIVERKEKECFKHSLNIFKKLARNTMLPRHRHYDMKINTMNFILCNENYDATTIETITYKTYHLACIRSVGVVKNIDGCVIVLRTRAYDNNCGFFHYFEVCENTIDAENLCRKINVLIENSEDNFIVRKHSENEFTINYKVLKYHVEYLNNIIKEVVDMAIVVARSIESKKKMEKYPKGGKSKKNRNASLCAMACSPTSEEFMDILQKVRLGLNFMARLNPFVNHPNVPELLHHMIAPFSLITAVCGLDIVKGVSKPLLSSRAIWLIENCFTTNELSFWRTLGEDWNKPKLYYTSCELFDDVYEPWFKTAGVSRKSSFGETISLTSCSTISGELKQGIILTNHTSCNDDEISVQSGNYVEIIKRVEGFYLVNNQNGCQGLVPKYKVFITHELMPHNDYLFTCIKEHICEYFSEWRSQAPIQSKFRENSSISSQYIDNGSENDDKSYISTKTTSSEMNSYKTKNSASMNEKGCHSKKESVVPFEQPVEICKRESEVVVGCKAGSLESIQTPELDGCKGGSSLSQAIQEPIDCKFDNQEKSDSKNVKIERKNKEKKHKENKHKEKKHKKSTCWCCTKKKSIYDLNTSDLIDKDSYIKSKFSPVKGVDNTKEPSLKCTKSILRSSSRPTTNCSIKEVQNQTSMDITKDQILQESKTSVVSQWDIKEEQADLEVKQELVEIESQQFCESDNEVKEEHMEEACIPPKAISLLWEKSEVQKEECIKIEGIKLFRVRIKLYPTEETPATSACTGTKATLLLKSSDEVSYKLNSKMSAIKGDTSPRVVTTYETNVSRSKLLQTPVSQKSLKDNNECNRNKSVSKKVGEEVPDKGSNSPKCVGMNFDECSKGAYLYCDGQLEASVQKSVSVNQTADSLKEQKLLKNKKYVKEMYREKDQTATSKADDKCQKKKLSSEEIYKILQKYIPAPKIPTLYSDDDQKDESSVSKGAIIDMFEKHICKDCGGMCQNTNESQNDASATLSVEDPQVLPTKTGVSNQPNQASITPINTQNTTSNVEIQSFKTFCQENLSLEPQSECQEPANVNNKSSEAEEVVILVDEEIVLPADIQMLVENSTELSTLTDCTTTDCTSSDAPTNDTPSNNASAVTADVPTSADTSNFIAPSNTPVDPTSSGTPPMIAPPSTVSPASLPTTTSSDAVTSNSPVTTTSENSNPKPSATISTPSTTSDTPTATVATPSATVDTPTATTTFAAPKSTSQPPTSSTEINPTATPSTSSVPVETPTASGDVITTTHTIDTNTGTSTTTVTSSTATGAPDASSTIEPSTTNSSLADTDSTTASGSLGNTTSIINANTTTSATSTNPQPTT